MNALITKKHNSLVYRTISLIVAITFLATAIIPPSYAQSIATLNLPIPGVLVTQSPAFVPVFLKGMTIHPEDPFRFDFIVDSGNTDFAQDEIKKESEKLVKYFLASMTIPKDDLWVNLSPYESDRIIPDELGKTELGRDMLAQDYLLKQLTASLMYPEEELGSEFWSKIYSKAQEKFGTTEIPMNTFNKVWIIPESATVYENDKTVYVVESRLKVLLDEDYVALENNRGSSAIGANQLPETQLKSSSSISSQIVREIILPEIEKEVNEGKNFAPLRQIYHSLILSKWYKETIKNSLLSKVYIDQKKTVGIEIDDQTIKEQIYAQYMEAYKKGVFDFIKEDYDQLSQEVIPRKYFSGGEKFREIPLKQAEQSDDFDAAMVGDNFQLSMRINPQSKDDDNAMLTNAQAKKMIEDKLDPRYHYLIKQDHLKKVSENSGRFAVILNQFIAKHQFAKVGLKPDLIFKLLIDNKWLIKVNETVGKLSVDLTKDQNKIIEIFGDDSSKVLSILHEPRKGREGELKDYIEIMTMAFNPLEALKDPEIFEVFRQIIERRYDVRVLEGKYNLGKAPVLLSFDGREISPKQFAKEMAEFLRDHAEENPYDVADDFRERFLREGPPPELKEIFGKYMKIKPDVFDLEVISDLIASYKFQVTDFSKPEIQISNIIEAFTGELGIDQPSFTSLEKAIEWLNDTIEPYQVFIQKMSEEDLDDSGKNLLKKIKEDYNKELRSFTEAELKEFVKTHQGQQFKWLILKGRYPLIAPEKLSSDRTIADIGAGHNILGKKILSYSDNNGLQVQRLIGTDINEWQDDTDRTDDRLEFIYQESPTNFPLSSNSYDSVIVKWVLHHMSVEDQRKFLKDIRRILKPGGKLIVFESLGATETNDGEIWKDYRRELKDASSWGPKGSWRGDNLRLNRDFKKLNAEQQLKLHAAEDYFGHNVVMNRVWMPQPFTYRSVKEYQGLLNELGFDENPNVRRVYGAAPIIRMGPPSIRLIFEKRKTPITLVGGDGGHNKANVLVEGTSKEEREHLENVFNILVYQDLSKNDLLKEKLDDIVIMGNERLDTFEEALQLINEGVGERIVILGGFGKATIPLIDSAVHHGFRIEISPGTIVDRNSWDSIRKKINEDTKHKVIQTSEADIIKQIIMQIVNGWPQDYQHLIEKIEKEGIENIIITEGSSAFISKLLVNYRKLLDSEEAFARVGGHRLLFMQKPHLQLRAKAVFDELFSAELRQGQVSTVSHTVSYDNMENSRLSAFTDVVKEAWRLVIYSDYGKGYINLRNIFPKGVIGIPQNFWDSANYLFNALEQKNKRALSEDLMRLMAEEALTIDELISPDNQALKEFIENVYVTATQSDNAMLSREQLSLIEKEGGEDGVIEAIYRDKLGKLGSVHRDISYKELMEAKRFFKMDGDFNVEIEYESWDWNAGVDVPKIKKVKGENISVVSGYENDTNLSDKKKIFEKASGESNLVGLKASLDSGIDVNAKLNNMHSFKNTALMIAVDIGDIKQVKLLLDYNADVTIQDDYGHDALYWAVDRYHSEVKHELAARGLWSVGEKSLFDSDNWGDIGAAKFEIIKLLLAKGSFLSKKKSLEKSLFESAYWGDIKTARLLLDKGANPNYRFVLTNETPFSIALKHSRNTEVVDLLLAYGADITKQLLPSSELLFRAVENGHLEATKILLKNGANINEDVWGVPEFYNDRTTRGHIVKGQTPLHFASNAGHIDVVKFLLDNGADVDGEYYNKLSPLHLASVQGHLEVVRMLLKKGAFVDVKGNIGFGNIMRSGYRNVYIDGVIPLHLAAENGHLEVVNLLLKFGANINIKDNKGHTALDYSITGNHIRIIELLKDAEDRAMISSSTEYIDDYEDDSLIDSAMMSNDKWKVSDTDALWRVAAQGIVEMIKPLFNERHFNINAKDPHFGLTALWLASQNGHDELVEYLLANGADPNIPNNNGIPPILIAAEKNRGNIVRMLLEKGAHLDTTARFKSDTSPLFVAAQEGNIDIVKQFLNKGVNVDEKRQSDGVTPLIAAVNRGNIQIVNLLINFGASLYEKTRDGHYAKYVAVYSGYLDIAKILEKAEEEPEFIKVVRGGDFDKVKKLLEAGLDINMQTINGLFTPLLTAIQNGHYDIVELLLKAGANPNLKLGNNQTALYSAVLRTDIAKLLLNAGVNINEKGQDGTTALMGAIENKNAELVEFLLAQGSDVKLKDNFNVTPLWKASSKGLTRLAKLLLEKGSDINSGDDLGITPLIIAVHNGHIETVRFLIANDASVNKEDAASRTALFYAASSGNKLIIKDLIEAGARVDLVDNQGKGILAYAQKNVVDILKSHGATNEGDNAMLSDNFGETHQKGQEDLAMTADEIEYLLKNPEEISVNDLDSRAFQQALIYSKDPVLLQRVMYIHEHNSQQSLLSLIEKMGATEDQLVEAAIARLTTVDSRNDWGLPYRFYHNTCGPDKLFLIRSKLEKARKFFLKHAAYWLRLDGDELRKTILETNNEETLIFRHAATLIKSLKEIKPEEASDYEEYNLISRKLHAINSIWDFGLYRYFEQPMYVWEVAAFGQEGDIGLRGPGWVLLEGWSRSFMGTTESGEQVVLPNVAGIPVTIEEQKFSIQPGDNIKAELTTIDLSNAEINLLC